MILWNSKSEVIKCLHGQDGQKQKIPSQQISKLELMMIHQRDLMNIAKPIVSHGRKQSDEEYIYFWRRNKNIGLLLYLGGRTVNRYSPDPCGSGVNILLHLPQKVNHDFAGGVFLSDSRSGTRLYKNAFAAKKHHRGSGYGCFMSGYHYGFAEGRRAEKAAPRRKRRAAGGKALYLKGGENHG